MPTGGGGHNLGPGSSFHLRAISGRHSALSCQQAMIWASGVVDLLGGGGGAEGGNLSDTL